MTDKTTAIMERVREVCEDKSKFIKPTHGTCCTCQRCGHPNDYECICFDIDDIHLEHLMRTFDDVHPKPILELHGASQLDIATVESHGRDNCIYDLTLTVEENLEQNKVLRDFIYSLICKV